jgi:hypothetical protein
LKLACSSASVECCKFLIANGADVDAGSHSAWRYVRAWLLSTHELFASLSFRPLVSSHLDPLYLTRRSPERHIETPLMALRDRNEYQHRALEPRAMQCRKMLLENGADPTISSSAWEHWSPIATAITHLTTGSLLESTVSSPVLSGCERHVGANYDEGLC